MLANMTSATYNTATGTVVVIIPNSTINGYINSVNQYQTANTISVPLPGNLVNLDIQSPTQMQITGYQSTLIDENYTILPGEFTSYSTEWYSSTRISGVTIQEAQTPNVENIMMGQSTNSVISDILDILVDIIDYLESHVHTGVTTGAGNSGIPLQVVPDDTDIIEDQTYISENHNLAITGTYEPK